MQTKRILGIVLTVVLVAACAKPADRAATYLKNAQSLYDKGDYKKARLEAKNAVQIDPKNVQARYLLALIAEKRLDGREMFGNLAVVVDMDPKFVPAQVKIGTMFFGAKNFDEAEKHAKAAAALAPNDPDVLVLNARLLFQKGNLGDGLKVIDSALAKRPNLMDAIVLKAAALGDASPDESLKYIREAIPKGSDAERKVLRRLEIVVLQNQKRTADVAEAYAALGRDYPKDAEIQNELARFLASQGKIDDAERVLRALTEQDPKDVDSRMTLGQFLVQLRSPEQARKALEEFVAKDPDSQRLRFGLARLYEATGKREDAVKAYQAIADKDPKAPEGVKSRIRLGAINLAMGKKDEGRKFVEDVIKEGSDEPEALLMRGGWRVGERKFDDAIADFRTVLRKEPNNRAALLFLARAYAVSGQLPLAKDTFSQLLTKNPGDPDASKELALVDARSGDPAGAEGILRKRLEVDAKDAEAKSMVVDLLLSKNDFVSAEATARELASGADDKAIGEYQLARALKMQKKYPQAVESFKRVLEKNPQLALAVEGLAGTYMEMGKKDDAVALLEGAVRKRPDDLAMKFLLAGTYAEAGRTAEAVKTLEALTAAKPNVPQFWIAWAGLYGKDPVKRMEILRKGVAAVPDNEGLVLLVCTQLESDGRYDESIGIYEKALAANPNLQVVANNLATLLLDRKTDKAGYARALELAKRFESSPVPNFLDTLGWAYYRNGQFVSAAPFLERAIARAEQVAAAQPATPAGARFRESISRETVVIHYHLGMAYVAVKNSVGARKELTRALADPKNNYPGSQEARAELQKLGPG